MVIEVGRLWKCFAIFEATSMSYIIISFSLSILTVAHSLMSLMCACIEMSCVFNRDMQTSVIASHQQVIGLCRMANQ